MRDGYRKDIDGMRAIAVLAVVFYHLGFGVVHGGFVGVDVFFVISGFLITGIIQREIDREEFTYTGFYERRVRRIFPALFAVLIATVAVGAVGLLPTDMRTLGSSLPPTLFFGSNFYFWRHSGYFDLSAELNPVLQTWSLAVEEQFYIGLPILLLLVHRLDRRRLKAALLAIAIISFGLCVYRQSSRPTQTFYLAPYRAWELMVGGLLAVGAVRPIRGRILNELLAASSLLLLLVSIALIEPGVTFPGWRAALPVLGTAGLLHTGASADSLTQRILRFRPLRWVGLISYSLYLWHWPIIVYGKFWHGLQPLQGVRWILLAIALIVAGLSYRFVEQPFRRRVRGQRPAKALAWGGAGGFALAGLGLLLVLSGGWPSRFPARMVELDQERHPTIPFRGCIDQTLSAIRERHICHVGAPDASPTLLVWGDSHSLAWIPALDEVFREAKVSGLFMARSTCPPLVGVLNPINPDCFAHNREAMKVLEEQPNLRFVVLAASWVDYSSPNGMYRIEDSTGVAGNLAVFPGALARTVTALRERGRAVWILGPVPGAPGDAPLRMAMAGMFGHDHESPPAKSSTAFRSAASYFYRAAEPLGADPLVGITDPTSWFCDATQCRYQTDGLPLYRDGGHLNVRGAEMIRPALTAAFTILEQKGSKLLATASLARTIGGSSVRPHAVATF